MTRTTPAATVPTSSAASEQRSEQRPALMLVLFLVASTAVAGLGSLATIDSVDGWYREADKPAFTPPDALFGPVWSVLYVAMAVAAWLAWRRGAPMTWWWVQLGLNLAWTPLFFGLQQLWLGLVVIVLLDLAVLQLISVFWRWSRPAALLLVPYLGWITFATLLNFSIARLN